jgi:Peptidase family S41
MRCLSALVLIIGSLAASSAMADPAPATLRAADLQADVGVLEKAYTQLHPGLYRYNTPAQMSGHFQALRRALDHDQSVADAYLAFSQFAATLRCGHSYANFYNQPKAIQAALFDAGPRVPFHFRWLGDRMVVTRNLSTDASLVPGTEVLAIDGIPSATILARLMTIARADGANDAKRIASLEVQGNDGYEAFDVFLPLFFPQTARPDRPFVLAVRDIGGATREVPVAGISQAQRRATRVVPDEKTDAPAWTLSFRDDGAAVLDMPTWGLYDSRWDWKKFLDETFADLDRRKTPLLVIDLRRNEGGLSVGDVLLAHLIDADLVLPQYERLVRYRRIPASLSPYLDTWDASFRDWGDDAEKRDARFYRLHRYDDGPEGDVIRPRSPKYAGKVVVLVGATNSSATFEFAWQARQNRLATLVGQATGGNQRGINGGAFFFLRLPHSGIELDLPLIGQFPRGDRPDAGIAPDVPVTLTREDIAQGRDPEMAAALALERR